MIRCHRCRHPAHPDGVCLHIALISRTRCACGSARDPHPWPEPQRASDVDTSWITMTEIKDDPPRRPGDGPSAAAATTSTTSPTSPPWTPATIRRRTREQWADHHGTCPDCDHPAHPRPPLQHRARQFHRLLPMHLLPAMTPATQGGLRTRGLSSSVLHMDTETATPHSDLVDETTYAVLYVENLRTKARRQVGVTSGTQARQMVTQSMDPRRLMFVVA